jgi:hypothetical protein
MISERMLRERRSRTVVSARRALSLVVEGDLPDTAARAIASTTRGITAAYIHIAHPALETGNAAIVASRIRVGAVPPRSLLPAQLPIVFRALPVTTIALPLRKLLCRVFFFLPAASVLVVFPEGAWIVSVRLINRSDSPDSATYQSLSAEWSGLA